MIRSISILLCTLVGVPAAAEVIPFEFDKSHADITFTVSHLGYSNTHGRFNDFDGKLMLDPDDISRGSVEVIIDTASVETSWPKRNEHLRSEDFFDVEQHPEMSFRSTGIEPVGPGRANMTGDLTLLGNTHSVMLDLVVNKIAPHPRTGTLVAGFTATGTLSRSQWGMDSFVPGIADEIVLRLDMEAAAVD